MAKKNEMPESDEALAVTSVEVYEESETAYDTVESEDALQPLTTVDKILKGQELGDLQSLVSLGQRSEREQGLVLRSVQIGLGTVAAVGALNLYNRVEKTSRLVGTMNDLYAKKLEEEIPTMHREMLKEEIAYLEEREDSGLKMLLKIAQGKSMFPEDSLSDDDRKVLQVLSAIKTPEQRNRFMEIIDMYLEEISGFESEESTELAPDAEFAQMADGGQDGVEVAEEVTEHRNPIEAYIAGTPTVEPVIEEGVTVAPENDAPVVSETIPAPAARVVPSAPVEVSGEVPAIPVAPDGPVVGDLSVIVPQEPPQPVGFTPAVDEEFEDL